MDSATGRDVYPDVEPNHNNGFNQSAPSNQNTVLPQPMRKEFRYAMASGTRARRIKAAMQTITREKPLHVTNGDQDSEAEAVGRSIQH